MNIIKNKFKKQYGYILSDNEILSLYQQGCLILSDKQENQLLEYFNL
jgi:hypothetical protein